MNRENLHGVCRLILDRMTEGKLTINILTWIKAYLIKNFPSALIHWHQWNEESKLLWLWTLFPLLWAAWGFFDKMRKYLRKLESKQRSETKKRREVSRVKPSFKNASLLEPWRNTPVFLKLIFPIARSHFGQFLRLLSWLDNASGTPHHTVDPRLQPKPSFSRCNGQMVIEFMFAGWINTAARLRIRSTSLSGRSQACCMVGNWLSCCYEILKMFEFW